MAQEGAKVIERKRDEHVAVVFAVDDGDALGRAAVALGLIDGGVQVEAGAAVALALKVPIRQAGHDHVGRTDPPRSLADLRAPLGRKTFGGQCFSDFALEAGAFLAGVDHVNFCQPPKKALAPLLAARLGAYCSPSIRWSRLVRRDSKQNH